jgi:hypothetical protein
LALTRFRHMPMAASFDIPQLHEPRRPTLEATHCPRKSREHTLHSSQWQGTSLRAPCGVRPTLTACSWVMRENRVPHYQRDFQKHDGLRIWQKVR